MADHLVILYEGIEGYLRLIHNGPCTESIPTAGPSPLNNRSLKHTLGYIG